VERIIDEEVTHIINECYKDAKQLLLEKKELLEKMAAILLEQEVINYEEIKTILGPK
jgi:ATP-dependent Zn protease